MPRGIPNASGRELHSEDAPLRPYKTIDMSKPQGLRAHDIIQSVDDDVLRGTYAEQLDFNEELLDIRIEPGNTRNAAPFERVQVNDDWRWLPVGIPVTVQRKFVENLARAQSFGVETEHGTAHEENPRNMIHKRPFRAVPFSILRDPNPRGAAWLNKISYEG
jgi:hypothetical protein